MLGVRVIPDSESRYWIKYGLNVAGEGLMRSLEEDESV